MPQVPTRSVTSARTCDLVLSDRPVGEQAAGSGNTRTHLVPMDACENRGTSASRKGDVSCSLPFWWRWWEKGGCASDHVNVCERKG